MTNHYTKAEFWRWTADQMDAIIERCPVKVFGASHTAVGMIPNRLVAVNSMGKAQVRQCRELIMDSGVRDPTVDNTHMIEQAEKWGRGVDWVVMKDFPNDRQRTIESLKEWVKIAPTDIMERTIVPLQGRDGADYLRCYEEALDLFPDCPYWGFGGIAGQGITKASSMQTIAHKQQAVEHLLDNTEIQNLHLFGQTNLQWTHIYQRPEIVSCDSAKFGHAVHYDIPRGKGGSQLHAWAEALEYYKFCMMISETYLPQGRRPKQHDFGGFFDVGKE